MQHMTSNECKVSIKLVSSRIRINKKPIRLLPLVEENTKVLMKIPEDVSSCMGIPFIPKRMRIIILNKDGLNRVVSKLSA